MNATRLNPTGEHMKTSEASQLFSEVDTHGLNFNVAGDGTTKQVWNLSGGSNIMKALYSLSKQTFAGT